MGLDGDFGVFRCIPLELCSFIISPRLLVYSKILLGIHDIGTSHPTTTFASEICALKPFLSRQCSRT